MQYLNSRIEADLVNEEGIELSVYKDSRGYASLGIGTCIEPGHGSITADEAYYLLRNRIDRAYKSLDGFSWFLTLDEIRQNVLIEMVFNMGLAGVMEFKAMIAAIQVRDYQQAASEMINSKWATQEPARVHRLANRMATGSN